VSVVFDLHGWQRRVFGLSGHGLLLLVLVTTAITAGWLPRAIVRILRGDLALRSSAAVGAETVRLVVLVHGFASDEPSEV
jgi:hypothetical protein